MAYRCGPPWDSDLPADELVELAENGRLKPGKALDIGCGTGSNVLYLAEKGFDASGMDISKVAIRKAVAKAKSRSLNGNFRILDFTKTKLVSKTLSTYDVLLDSGCFHSLSSEDRDSYANSLGLVSHRGSLYLLWCFLRGSRWSYGPPGVDKREVDERLSPMFRIIERRELSTSFRDVLFYFMEKS